MKQKKFILIIIIVCLFPQFLAAFNWPVVDPAVSSTFGADKWGSFGNGIEIYGDDLDVRPSEDGELIFFEDEGQTTALPGGLGNFAVVEHDRKLRTLYAGIESVENLDKIDRLTTADVIGKAGGSGKTVSPHLYFAVIDSEFEQWVNPLLLLNSIADNKAPVIKSIGLMKDSSYIPVEKRSVVKAGLVELLAQVYDPCMAVDFFCPMAPFKIQLFMNGEEVFYINFESLRIEAGEAVIQSHDKVRYLDFYRSEGFISLGEISLVPGDSRFEILVSDYAENETARTFQITVVE